MHEVGLWLPEYYRTSDFLWVPIIFKGSSGGSVVKNPPANTGVAGLIPESGRSPGEGNGNPL